MAWYVCTERRGHHWWASLRPRKWCERGKRSTKCQDAPNLDSTKSSARKM